MKTLPRLIAVAISALSVLAGTSSCKEPIPARPEFSISETEIRVPGSGGKAQVTYTLANPDPEAKISIDCTKDWLGGFDLSTEGIIAFEVEPSEIPEPREATVLVTYSAGPVQQTFTVFQEEGKEPEIAISIESVNEASVIFSLTPKDKEMPYIWRILTEENIGKYENEEAWFQAEIEYLEQLAEEYEMTFEQLVNASTVKGDQLSLRTDALNPDTGYRIYAYGITPEKEPLSGICHKKFKTENIEKIEMDFTLSYVIDGAKATIKVVPENNEQKYVFDGYPKSMVSDVSQIPGLYQEYINGLIVSFEQFGLTADDIVSMIARQGPAEQQAELMAETDYYGFAAAISDAAVIISDPVVEPFRTGEVTASDNQITLEIFDVTARSAKYSITTTNDDQYVFGIDAAYKWEGMSNQQILDELTGGDYNLSPLCGKGNKNEYMEGFEPATEYIAFIFGYSGGIATTDLQSVAFTTLEEDLADVTFKLLHDQYFDGTEASEKYPDEFGRAKGKAILPTKVETTGDVSSFFYHIFSGDLTDNTTYPESEIKSTLIQQGMTDKELTFYLEYDKVSTIVGFATDSEGNYGPLYREKILLSRDGVSPIEDLEVAGKECPASKIPTDLRTGQKLEKFSLQKKNTEKNRPVPVLAADE